MWTTTRSKRQLDSCFLNFDLICIFSFFWQVEDLAEQAECPDIEVLSNVSEKEVNTKKVKLETKKVKLETKNMFCWNINKVNLFQWPFLTGVIFGIGTAEDETMKNVL